MRSFRHILVAGAALTVMQTATAEVKWDFPTPYPASNFQTEIVQQFANDVIKATGGGVRLTVHPNGSLYKGNEIKRAVQTGQAQIGEILLSSAANENPLFGVDSIPFLASSYPEARRLSDISRPATEKLLASQGLKLLYVSPWPPQGLYSIKPVANVADLRGTKMRTYNPATNRIAQIVKAQPVTIQAAELGQALATGTVENLLSSSPTGIENKIHEQTKYFYEVNAWVPRNAVIVSQKAFDALDKPAQESVIKAAREAEARGWRVSEEKNKDYIRQLTEVGMKVSAPSPQFRSELAAIADTMTAEWLKVASPEARQIIDAYKTRKP